ncbi:hypothetical protein GXB81_13925 [Paraburkholderia sp. Ac-20336]|uniref:hypothetical protein n=1 Tax=Paraburkholderia sp. Ac-20336 TaxID=2703886 RepID=UPI00197FE698|nr:hypothetical protein [Paraburkholderia sp. Ac-20336]MBN3804138.1 hypothetical protein [Paraburkholderia sp. Ac-20336]
MAWTPLEGAALHVPSGPHLHLFVVLNDPKQLPGYGQLPQVGLANFSTVPHNAPYDNTCCFQAGAHPFIQKDSYVYYGDLRIYSVADIVSLVTNGVFKPHPTNFTQAEVTRIKNGIDFSPRTKRAFKGLGL